LSSVLSHSAFICQVCVLNAKLHQTSFMTSFCKKKVFWNICYLCLLPRTTFGGKDHKALLMLLEACM